MNFLYYVNNANWTMLLVGLLVSFVSVTLKGFQHKNIQGNHYKLVFATSYLMAITDVVSVGLIVKNGWAMVIPCATGAAFGMVFAMKTHSRFIKRSDNGS